MIDLRPTVTIGDLTVSKCLDSLEPLDMIAVDNLTITWGRESVWDTHTPSEVTFSLWMHGDTRHFADTLQSGHFFKFPMRIVAGGRTIFSGILRSVRVRRVTPGPWGGPAWRADILAAAATAELANRRFTDAPEFLGSKYIYGRASKFLKMINSQIGMYDHIQKVHSGKGDPFIAIDQEQFTQSSILDIIQQIYQSQQLTNVDYNPHEKIIQPVYWPIAYEWAILDRQHNGQYIVQRTGGQWKYHGSNIAGDNATIDACDLSLDEIGCSFEPSSRLGTVSVTAPTNVGSSNIAHMYEPVTKTVYSGSGEVMEVTTCRAGDQDYIGRYVLEISDDLFGVPQFPILTYKLGHESEKNLADALLKTWCDLTTIKVTGSVLHQWLDSLPIGFPPRTRIGNRMMPIGGTITYTATHGWECGIQMHPLVIANAKKPLPWIQAPDAMSWNQIHSSVTWDEIGRVHTQETSERN